MGIFSKLFNKNAENETNNKPLEYLETVKFNEEMLDLLDKDSFLARSDYKGLVEKYAQIAVFFENSKRAETLNYYRKQNKININEITSFLSVYDNIKDLAKGSKMIDSHNEEYIQKHLLSEKDYLDNILKEIDPKILLDEEQRRVILSDEDYSLVIAGAGAGKTTTVAAKVRYLVEKKHIDPKQILVISFTNKAVGELKERINNGLHIPCPITTFHSAGYAILRKQDEIKKSIVDDGFLFNVVNNYLKSSIMKEPELVDKLIMFFGSYFETPYEGEDLNDFFNYISKADFSTLKSNINEYNDEIIDIRSGKITTITNETLRSFQEVQIANFLYLNNIEYVYEKPYQYHILKAKKPYTPDFYIKQGDKTAYIEHFGITQDGRNNRYSPEQIEKYKKEVLDKIALHKKHGTTLIYTFSKYNDGRELTEHLQEELVKRGFVLKKRSSEEVFQKLVNTEENKYISRLVNLICVFISNFKTDGYTIDDFYRFERSNTNVRTKLFLDVAKECYLEYQKKLAENNCLDFQDMINDSARILREKRLSKEELDFKYIIVDEYQDISQQRFDLTKELSNICSAKIIAVGDDWQSIYAFSGSNITLFTHFCSIMGYGKELKITKTYRNAQEVIDIAGNFIQKNDSQIKKSLLSPKHIQKPVIVETYSDEYNKKEVQGKGGKYLNLGKEIETVLRQILETNEKEGKGRDSSTLLIGRYNFDARNICFSNNFLYDDKNGKVISKKYPHAKLEFLTAHSSKGLGYDNVIIVNARNEMYGFPSKVDNDPVMQLVIHDDKSIEYAEERRLFYVALTRTKNRVYIVTPQQHPSEFILELLRDYPNITLQGQISQESKDQVSTMKRCPICGYPLQLRWKKNYGLRLWMCTNEPEICNFITNDLSGEGMSIQKCDRCKDGYLIVKKTQDGPILGCTNYKEDGTGCDRLINKDYYKRRLTEGFENDTSVDKPAYRHISVQKRINNPMESKSVPIPQHKPVKTKTEKRKKVDVHKVKRSLNYIEKDGFSIIVDEEGQIITDIKLLSYLRGVRAKIAKDKNVPAYIVISNKGLVSLATYRPSSREEFIKLQGLGEGTYAAYGNDFMKAIKDFQENSK